MNVLIADDDRFALMTLGTMLTRDGHAVTSATSGKQALEAIEQDLAGACSLEAVITDWVMPDFDGLDLAQEIKARRPNLKVIVLTGYGVVIPEDPCVDVYLAKPAKADDLRRALDFKADS
jgi:two-component system, response regulator RegA